MQARCPGDTRLLLAADDIRESLLDLPPVQLGPGIDAGLIRVGQVLLANLEIAEGTGALTATGIAEDSSATSANDRSLAQGDLK